MLLIYIQVCINEPLHKADNFRKTVLLECICHKKICSAVKHLFFPSKLILLENFFCIRLSCFFIKFGTLQGKISGSGVRWVSKGQLQNTTLISTTALSLTRSKGGKNNQFWRRINFQMQNKLTQQSETRQNKLKYIWTSKFFTTKINLV